MIFQDFINNLSIKNKLSFVVMIACTIVLFLIGNVVLVVEIYTSRASLVHEMRILGDSLIEAVRLPLLLEKQVESEKQLQSLAQQKNIHAAYLLNRHGEPIAEYLDIANVKFVIAALEHDFTPNNREALATGIAEHLESSWSHLSIFVPIIHDGRFSGTLYMVSDLHALYSGLFGVVFGGLMALLLLIAFSWLLGEWVQKPISVPLMELSTMMREVSIKRRYSARAVPHSYDEIGQLVSGFNSMLEQIELHQMSLARHQQQLESTVNERTRDLREAITELKFARKQADAANEAKSLFLSRMTHELRTPMIGVLGMNELLSRTALDERQAVLVEMVQKSGHELLSLIKNILDISKIESGHLDLDTVDVDLFEIGEDAVSLLAPSAAEKGLTLVSYVPLDAVWKVRADEQRIRQIVMNLVGNAIKFTNSGYVRLVLSLEKIKDHKGLFVIDVEDSGIGMDETDAKKIFDQFYQIDGSNTRVQSGAGLGLAIVKQLIELMDGDLKVASQLGQGSCFSVRLWLPLIEQVEFLLPPKINQFPALICASESEAVQQLHLRLCALGFLVDHVTSVADAREALIGKQQDRQSYGYVFVDYDLCSADGVRFYEILKEQDYVCRYGVIVISDYLSDLPAQVERLNFPLTWKRLIEVLRANSQLKVPDVQQKISALGFNEAGTILIVSNHIAKNELLRLAFAPEFLDKVLIVNSLSAAQQYLATSSPGCLLIDVAELNAEQCSTFISETRVCSYIVGYSDQTVSSEMTMLFDKFFVRPSATELVAYTADYIRFQNREPKPGADEL
jgi:signal transduction histidine kinase